MSFIAVVLLVFLALGGMLGIGAYLIYRQKLRKAKAIERGLKMVPILIHLPSMSEDTDGGTRDVKEVMREKTAQAEVLYNLLAGTSVTGFKSTFYGQRHIALELIASEGMVHFYAAVPVALVSTVEKAIQTAYPGARMEMVEDHNIFNQEGRLAATLGGEMILRTESAYPIATYSKLDRDPMDALLTTVSALEKNDGVAFQLMVRPATSNWIAKSLRLVEMKRRGHKHSGLSPQSLLKAVVKAPSQQREEDRNHLGGQSLLTNLEQAEIENIEEKTKHPGFEVLIRVIVSTGSVARSQQMIRDIATTFALYDAPGLNGFTFLPAVDVQGLVTAFIFRFFPPELKGNVLNSVELATLFHLPDAQFTPSAAVERQKSKQVDGPVRLPSVGLLFGFNEFRGVKKEIRLSAEDRRRHTYILGQTGTGKSTMLENLAVQDMLAGNGFAFIDPHGDSAEKLLALVPKGRAEDVIYFNPADTQYPLGLNLFEFNDPSQKDFLVQETINMLYKLYDPGKTGIIGPRYEHWYRNAALTLMSDPGGSTFIEIPKVFTDTEYLKKKFRYLKDPTVIDFWTKEMGQTSDYHKSEMLGWFVSKFGAFQNNEMMRNIIGQTKSAFNIREVMDQKKILIVNLSKGRIGELNSQLLGMIFVIKFQAAAMSRANVPEDQRPDFSLYVDEFQNFSTDSFASILSEARKYRLNLIVANQFIGQLSNEIRDAVFGNIGTIVAHRMGPEDADFMVKQFAPVFDARDLMNIPNYNAAMRLMIGGLPSQPFTILDSPPLGSPNLELGMAVKQLSAAKYGHEKAAVEADIFGRLSSAATPPPASISAEAMPAPVAAASVTPPVAAPVAPALPEPVVDTIGQAQIGQRQLTALEIARARVQTGNVEVPKPPVEQTPETPPAVEQPVVEAPAMPAASEASASFVTPVASVDPPVAIVAPATPEPQPVVPLTPEPLELPGVAVTPPPIGAPPVDLPLPDDIGLVDASNPVTVPDAAVLPTDQGVELLGEPAPRPSETGSLSVMDITGGRTPGESRTLASAPQVPILESEVTGVEEVAAEPAYVIPIGSGEPSAGDPYAHIDILGDVSQPQSSMMKEIAPAPAPVPASVPVSAPALPQLMTEPEPRMVVDSDPSAQPAEAMPSYEVEPVINSVPISAADMPAEPGPEPEPDPEPEPPVAEPPESFIHFVDPAAERVLAQTTIPDPVQSELPEVSIPETPVPELVLAPVAPAVLEHLAVPAQPLVLKPLPVQVPLTILPVTPDAISVAQPQVAETPPQKAKTPEPQPSKLQVVKPKMVIEEPVAEPARVPQLESVAQMLDEAHVPMPLSQADIKRGAVNIAAQRAAEAKPDAAKPDAAKSAELPVTVSQPVESAVQKNESASATPAPEVAPVSAPLPVAVPEPEPVNIVAAQPTETKTPATSETMPPSVKPAAPQDSPEDQVKAAQHEIDDLLSQSLIKLDGRKRLSEPVGPVEPEDNQELTASAMKPLPKKVVLQPISSQPLNRRALAAELLKEEAAEARDVPASVVTQSVAAQPAPRPEARPPIKADRPILRQSTPVPVITKHGGDLLPEVPVVVQEEFGIPQAESLAVDDVARARAEREAQQKLPATTSTQAAAQTPAGANPAVSDANQARPTTAKISRHHQRRRDLKPAEKIESPEEAAHNQPNETQMKVAPLAGQLIMPSAQKQPAQLDTQHPIKPKKLATGEVFVDEKGNVLVGE